MSTTNFPASFIRYSLVPLSVALLSLQFIGGRTDPRKFNDVDSIIAYVSNSNRTFAVSLDCDKLRRLDDVHKFEVTKFKNRILYNLSVAKPFDEPWHVDTRAQLEIWHSTGKVDTVCIGTLPEISYSGQLLTLGNRDIPYLLDSLWFSVEFPKK